MRTFLDKLHDIKLKEVDQRRKTVITNKGQHSNAINQSTYETAFPDKRTPSPSASV